MPDDNNREVAVWCECHGEGVMLSSDDCGVEMAMVYIGRRQPQGIWDKLRWCCNILSGSLWLDQVILSPENARHLAKRLHDHAMITEREMKELPGG